MDASIRTRLLELPRLYAEAGTRLVEKSHQLTEVRALAQAFKAKVEASFVERWREARTNEQVRSAELANELATRDDYQRATANIQALEWTIAADRQLLESLRFEQQVLLGVLAADGTETRSIVRAIEGAVGCHQMPVTDYHQKEAR